jgi:uncharacterized protein (TIGR02265 family)
MMDCSTVLFPNLHIRQGLRKLGRAAPQALLNSTLGRVVLSTVSDPVSALEAFSTSYGLHLKPGHAEVIEAGPAWALVALRDVHYLLDSNQVGSLEGILKLVGVRGHVTIRRIRAGCADFLVTW